MERQASGNSRPHRSNVKAPAKFGDSPSPAQPISVPNSTIDSFDPAGSMAGGNDFMLKMLAAAVDAVISVPPARSVPPIETQVTTKMLTEEADDAFDDQPALKRKKLNPSPTSSSKPRSQSVKEVSTANKIPTLSFSPLPPSPASLPPPAKLAIADSVNSIKSPAVLKKRKASDGMITKPGAMSKTVKKNQIKAGVGVKNGSSISGTPLGNKLEALKSNGSAGDNNKPIVGSPMIASPAMAPGSGFASAMSAINRSSKIGGIPKLPKKEAVVLEPIISPEEITRRRIGTKLKNRELYGITTPLLDPARVMGEFEGKLRAKVHALQAATASDRPLPRLNTFGSVFSLFPNLRPDDRPDSMRQDDWDMPPSGHGEKWNGNR